MTKNYASFNTKYITLRQCLLVSCSLQNLLALWFGGKVAKHQLTAFLVFKDPTKPFRSFNCHTPHPSFINESWVRARPQYGIIGDSDQVVDKREMVHVVWKRSASTQAFEWPHFLVSFASQKKVILLPSAQAFVKIYNPAATKIFSTRSHQQQTDGWDLLLLRRSWVIQKQVSWFAVIVRLADLKEPQFLSVALHFTCNIVAKTITQKPWWAEQSSHT